MWKRSVMKLQQKSKIKDVLVHNLVTLGENSGVRGVLFVGINIITIAKSILLGQDPF